jgi:hypothetical protein
MSGFSTALRILALILTGAVALYYTGIVLLTLIALASADSGEIGAARLLGALLADLVFIAIFMRLLRSLRSM